MRSDVSTLILVGASAGVAALVGPGIGLLAVAGAVGVGTYAGVRKSLDTVTESVADCQLAAAGSRKKHRRRIIKDAQDEFEGNKEIAKWCGIAGFACPPLGLAAVGTMAYKASQAKKRAAATKE